MSGIGELKPAQRISPGEVIKKDLLILDLNEKELAAITHINPQTIEGIINHKTSISEDLAERLSIALGDSPEYWLNLDRQFWT